MLRVRKAALKFPPTILRQEDANYVMETNEVLEHSSGRHKSSCDIPSHLTAREKQLSSVINMIPLSKAHKICCKTGLMGPFDLGDGKHYFYKSIQTIKTFGTYKPQVNCAPFLSFPSLPPPAPPKTKQQQHKKTLTCLWWLMGKT